MYPFVLALHNIVRWLALILGILTVARSLLALRRRQAWKSADRRWGVFFTSAMDLQLLLGLLLYFFISPLTRSALQDFGAAMGNPGLRFFALEHALYMFLAVVFAHLGSVFVKRTGDDASRHRTAMIWYGLAVLLLLLGMPWSRPLFPGL